MFQTLLAGFCALLFLVDIDSRALANDICMSTATYVNTGESPRGLYAANINTDPFPDLFVCNYIDNTISFYRTDNRGYYRDPILYPAGFGNFGYGPTSVTGGDFDGDGDTDIAFASFLGNAVGILEQSTYAGFSTPVFANAGYAPYWVAAGDVDGDGDLDLATADGAGHSVSIVKNDGYGNFTYFGTYQAGIEPHCVVLADFDSDGDLDFATANRKSDDAIIQFNDGTGVFSGRTRLVSGREPLSLVATDFDDDGDTDIAIANNVESTVSIFLNDGSAGFELDAKHSVGSRPHGIASADFDNDGDLDLVTCGTVSLAYSILKNDGAAKFGSAEDSAIGGAAVMIAPFDANADGLIDIASPLPNEDCIIVNINRGEGFFPPIYQVSVGELITGRAVAKLDGDAFPDLAATSYEEGSLRIFSNSGSGRMALRQSLTGLAEPISVLACDVDGDEDEDLVLGLSDGQTITVFAQQDGEFVGTLAIQAPRETNSIQKADFDNDGDFDLIAGLLPTGPGPQPAIFLLENVGGGIFEPHAESFDLHPSYTRVLANDLNGDGRVDVIKQDDFDKSIYCYFNLGDWQFSAGTRIPLSSPLVYSAMADLDQDADLDILASTFSGPALLETFWNDGAGNFLSSGPQPHSGLGRYPELVDFNSDGLVDIGLTGERDYHGISIFTNLGGTFSQPQEFDFSWAVEVTDTDLDLDGDEDFVFFDFYGGRLTIRMNCTPVSYAAGDANGDGQVNITDAVFLINFIFAGGSTPDPYARGDINHDYIVNISDAVRIIQYLFMGVHLK